MELTAIQDGAGDGQAGEAPAPPSVPAGTSPFALAGMIAQLLDAQRQANELAERQVELAAERNRLLEAGNEVARRALLADVAELTFADVMAALQVGRTKLLEMIEDGVVPMYKRGGSNEWRIGVRQFQALLRSWQSGG